MSSVPPNNDSTSVGPEEAPPAEPVVVPRRRFQRVSLVWAVPLLAIFLGFYLAFSLYRGQGPTVTIIFDNAEGLIAGKTPIRYRDVNIGVVDDIRLSENLESVVVKAKMSPDTRRYLNNRARFWVVRPRVHQWCIRPGYVVVGCVYSGKFGCRWRISKTLYRAGTTTTHSRKRTGHPVGAALRAGGLCVGGFTGLLPRSQGWANRSPAVSR